MHSPLEDKEKASTEHIERIVDSDDAEDLSDSLHSLKLKDPVKESLEKDLHDRTEDDINVLLEYMECFPVFANMTLAMRRAMCAVMQFAEVEEAGTVVLEDGEELDSWSVVIRGQVEVEHEGGRVEELHAGDSFGVIPTTEKMYHQGVMRTKETNCQFVCIMQGDYYRIFHPVEESTHEQGEDSEDVPVTDHQASLRNRRGRIYIRGSIVRSHSLHPNFLSVYLLAPRIGAEISPVLMDYWTMDPNFRNKVMLIIR